MRHSNRGHAVGDRARIRYFDPGKQRVARTQLKCYKTKGSKSNAATRGAPGRQMNPNEIKELVTLLAEKDIAEFEMERDDVKLRIKRSHEAPATTVVTAGYAPPAPMHMPQAVPMAAAPAAAPASAPAAAGAAAAAAPASD